MIHSQCQATITSTWFQNMLSLPHPLKNTILISQSCPNNPFPHLLATTNLLSVCMDLPIIYISFIYLYAYLFLVEVIVIQYLIWDVFYTFYINGIIKYVVFSDWLLRIMFSRFSQVGVYVSTFLLLNNIPFYGSANIVFIYSSVGRYLDHFYLLNSMNNANISFHV